MSEIFAQEWPQYLGPNRNSTSQQNGILRTWPADGPQVLWTVDVGKGFGGPVIKDGKVHLLDRTDEVEDIMISVITPNHQYCTMAISMPSSLQTVNATGWFA